MYVIFIDIFTVIQVINEKLNVSHKYEKINNNFRNLIVNPLYTQF